VIVDLFICKFIIYSSIFLESLSLAYNEVHLHLLDTDTETEYVAEASKLRDSDIETSSTS